MRCGNRCGPDRVHIPRLFKLEAGTDSLDAQKVSPHRHLSVFLPTQDGEPEFFRGEA